MQINSIRRGVLLLFFLALLSGVRSQVNTVQFGKNRVQHTKFKWKFYQSENFNTYFNQGGLELGKYVTQLAESELPQIEDAVEYSLQRKVSLVIYNSYEDYRQTNIGLETDIQSAGGATRLVNNKMLLYFDGNHNNLRRQVREGIARVLVDNILFGDDIGEFASNQALLDLPQWLVDGYVTYIAENWSTEKDDQLKSAIMGSTYRNFYQFAFERPQLAGHALWHYVGEKYKKENVTYFLYLARIYKNLNTASQRITKKKFKDLLAEFMEFQETRYQNDIRQRKNAPRGQLTVMEETKRGRDYYRFAVNPNRRSNDYAVVEFRNNVYRVNLIENFGDKRTLLKFGVKTLDPSISPNYPILAWDNKGSRLLVIYWKDGKTRMFVYDQIARIKRFQQVITGFDQIIDAGFMLDANTLLLSAVKNGHTDIFTYKIDSEKIEQITNDVFDDLDPVFVSFPNRTGIIFSSNRPGTDQAVLDTAMPSNSRFNIFLVDMLNKEFRQISQLTDMKFGNARYPMPYNINHFTFVSDENGIGNRWAGFFRTERTGLDTLYHVGDELLRNPTNRELDSSLKAWQKMEPDSISYFQTYRDSTYTFPITNYQSSLIETRIAGDAGVVSELRREGDLKMLYKLKVDSIALRRRNVNARPTDFLKKIMQNARSRENVTTVQRQDTATTKKKQFQSEFEDEESADVPAPNKNDQVPSYSTIVDASATTQRYPVLQKSKLFDYGLAFNADYVVSGVSNNILVNRFQPFAGGAGPIRLNNGNDLNWTFRVGSSDIMEDIKVVGGFRFGTSLSDKDVFITVMNFRRRIDWGFTYFRSNQRDYRGAVFNSLELNRYGNNFITNLYQVHVNYPFNEVKSLRLNTGLREDKAVFKPYYKTAAAGNPAGAAAPDALLAKDVKIRYLASHLEYVHDNTINPSQNIWNGLRYKVFFDFTMPINDASLRSANTFNLGFDARHYLKIYRNTIWAVRAAGDFSFGERKIVYYVGGMDGWFNPKFYSQNAPAPDQTYGFQTLAVNLRGFHQNIANGNNAVIINSEVRFPVFSTIFSKPINNAFLRNFQLVQFIDLGTAWNGEYNAIQRPNIIYGPVDNNPVRIKVTAGGLGPFAGGYGMGVRSTLLGYFLKFDAAWQMNGFFRGKPVYYFAMGLDF